MAELVARVEKLEDFKAEQDSLARVRVKGCPALLAAAQELDKGTKEFWKLKEQVGDLVWENLEPLVAHNLTPENVRAAKQEWKVCTAAEGLVGVFPVGGSWGNPPLSTSGANPAYRACA